MDPTELERYLHEHIPLSAAMQASVLQSQADRVVLSAPLEPNINHRATVFGGSASALATLAAWSLVHARLRSAGLSCRVVIQRNEVDYRRPLTGTFTATAVLAHPEPWARFLQALRRRGRGRIDMEASIEQDGQEAGRFSGTFAALPERVP